MAKIINEIFMILLFIRGNKIKIKLFNSIYNLIYLERNYCDKIIKLYE